MTTPDPFPATADIVIVQHRWWDANTRRGVAAEVTWTPITSSSDPTAPNLVDASARGWVKTREWRSRPHRYSGYMAVPLTATNDPDLSSTSGFGGYRVQAAGEAPFTILVDAATPKVAATLEMSQALAQLDPPVTLEVGTQVRAVWLTDLAVTDPPPPPSLYFTATQTTNLVLDTVAAHDADAQAHPAIRALIGQGGATPDATTGTKGKARLLAGTADNPLVPWSAVTGAPTSYPPSGGAGGVLSGTYPNVGFAFDMAYQSELDAVAASIPEVARDALAAALVQGPNITITPNDAADTITISATTASGTTVPTRTTAANTTAVPGELLVVDATGGQRTVTPPASPALGTFVTVLKSDGSANYVVWDGPTNSDTSAGLVKPWSGARFTWLGSVWAVTATNLTSGGGASSRETRIAATTLSGQRLVVPTATGSVTYADNSTLDHRWRPLWLTLAAAASGAYVDLQLEGSVSDSSWSWTAGPLYLGANGVMTQTVPTSGFVVQVGYATSPTSIYLDRQPSIALAS